MIELIKPNPNHKSAVLEYLDEFSRANETIHGSGSLDRAGTYEEWLEVCVANESEETTPEGRVPASQYLAFRESDGKLVGMIAVRHSLNDYLRKEGGHIGYSVRKSERRKGYATQMLKAALIKCKELGMDQVLITCNSDNIGSASVIKANGGVFENCIESHDGEMMDRYWITIS